MLSDATARQAMILHGLLSMPSFFEGVLYAQVCQASLSPQQR